MKWLMHYGTPRHSGRYPWGSGANPYQTERKSLKKGSIRSTVSTNKNLNKELDSNRPLYTYDKTILGIRKFMKVLLVIIKLLIFNLKIMIIQYIHMIIKLKKI